MIAVSAVVGAPVVGPVGVALKASVFSDQAGMAEDGGALKLPALWGLGEGLGHKELVKEAPAVAVGEGAQPALVEFDHRVKQTVPRTV